MKIAVLGAGALGSVVGASLFRAGCDVTLLDLNTAHLDAINRDGLRVDWDEGSETYPIPAMLPEKAPRADLVILLTKTYHSDAALAGIAPLIEAGAHVLTLQNGLGNVERVAARVPRSRILYGCTMTPADFRAPGHVASHGKAHTPFAPLEADGAADLFGPALAPAGFEMTPEAPVLVWKKAAFNCAMNAAGMLGGGSVGDIATHLGPDLAAGIAAEVVALARAEGVALDLAPVRDQIAFAMAEHLHHKPSMLQDLQAGRKTEIEALNGHVASRANQLGLSAPLNALLAALVRMREATAARQSAT